MDLETIDEPVRIEATAARHIALGNALLQRQRFAEAVASYRLAAELQPGIADLHNNLGYSLEKLGHLNEAIESLRRAVALCPQQPRAYFNLGNVLAKQGRLEEAVASYRTVVALDPRSSQAYHNLGLALGDQQQLPEAIACLRRSILIKPDNPETHNSLGLLLSRDGRLTEAASSYRCAIALEPDFVEAHNNLGTALDAQGLLDAAIISYRQAVALAPDFADAHTNLAMVLLAAGHMHEGWQEYEWRFRTPDGLWQRRDLPGELWMGQPATGATLLIHAEQGFGDTLQFCRYATLAAASGLHVILEVPAPLVRLVRGLKGVEQVIRHGDELPPYDFYTPMLSLPFLMRDNHPGIPSSEAYLAGDVSQTAAWRTRLATARLKGPRVGLAWAGAARNQKQAWAAIDRRRSIAPERMAPLFEVEGIHFFSLQKGPPAAPKDFPLIDVMQEMADFADTAALIANLDLVISVDTAVAHLGAALGKPVWLLNRFDSCWRWGITGHDSPWYPTLRLYRQPKPDDWDTVLAQVASDLRQFRPRPR